MNNLISNPDQFTTTFLWPLLIFGICITTALIFYLKIQRKRTNQLNENELQHSAIISKISEALITYDDNGLIKSVNPATEILFGYTSNELINIPVNQLIPSIPIQNYNTSFDESLINLEVTAVCNNETRKQISISINVMQLSVGKRFLACIHDITQQKKNEKILTNQTRNALLLHQATTIANETSSFIESLQSCIDLVCNSLGWPVGLVFIPDNSKNSLLASEIWHFDDIDKHAAFKQTILNMPLKRGEGMSGKIWLTGTSSWLENYVEESHSSSQTMTNKYFKSAVGFPIYVDHEIVAILSFYLYKTTKPDHDLLRVLQLLGEQVGRVFEKRRAEKAITDAEEKSRLILESTSEGLFGLNKEGYTTFVNPAAEKMIGYSAAELKNTPMHNLIQHSTADGTIYPSEQCKMFLANAAGEELHIEDEVFWRKDNRCFPVEYTCTPMWKDFDIIGSVITFRDISERLRVEKMKNEFVSTVSHELRTPLTSIRGSLGMLAGGIFGEFNEKATELITIANNNSERLLNLINDLLDMDKIVSGNMEFVMRHHDIYSLIEQSITNTDSYAKQYSVSFQFKSQFDTAIAHIDDNRFLQVMANLLSNAAKFSPRDDIVEVRIFTTAEGKLRIEVEDHGPGIPNDFHHKIFEKFSQADSSDTRQKGGTGLGLNISREILMHMEGRIDFDTEIGEGTTFYFELPDYTNYVEMTDNKQSQQH